MLLHIILLTIVWLSAAVLSAVGFLAFAEFFSPVGSESIIDIIPEWVTTKIDRKLCHFYLGVICCVVVAYLLHYLIF